MTRVAWVNPDCAHVLLLWEVCQMFMITLVEDKNRWHWIMMMTMMTTTTTIIIIIIIVTNSQVLFHNGTLLHSKSQYTTVKHSRKLFEHVYTSDLYGLGTLTPIEFFQQDLLWQSSNTHSHSCSIKLPNTRRDNPSSGYWSTCTPQRHLGV
jgi:hypothetical protein